MRLIALGAAALPGVAHAHAPAAVDAWGILVAASLALSAALYVAALRRGAPLPAPNAAAFAAGWLAVALAVLSPLQRLAAESFGMHMVQHELLMVVAPPLLILGRPFTALAAVLPRAWIAAAALPLRIPPPAAFLLHALALWVWHVPALFEGALASSGVHALQHATFFGTALLFWWAVFRRLRAGTAALYILATMIHTGALAALLTFAPAPIYASAPLEEQQLGGLLMWVPAGYAMLLAGLLAFDRLLGERA